MATVRPALAALTAAVAAALSWVLFAPAPAQAATAAERQPSSVKAATLYVVQGVADLTPAISLDGRVIAKAAPPRTIIGPIDVAPGRHVVQLWRGASLVTQAAVQAGPGSSTDVVAHRFPDAQRAPSFTTFRNDLSPVPDGRSRLLIAHTAVVPPADILLDGEPVVENAANGESATRLVPQGSYDVSIVPTATDGPDIFGPTTLALGSGTLTNVFAIGDPAAGTMDAVVQVLPLSTTAAPAPGRVDTGDGGQAAGLFPENRRGPALLALPAPVGLGGLTAAALVAALLLAGCGSRTATTAPASGAVPSSSTSSAGGPGRSSARSLAPAPVQAPADAGAAPVADSPAPDAAAGSPSGTEPFAPSRLTLPSGRVADVVPASVGSSGSLAIPEDPARIAWWTGGARPGDPFGSTVLAGHVDSRRYGLGALAELATARPGLTMRVGDGARAITYRIATVTKVPKARLVQDADAFSQKGSARLVLITCGGAFDPVTHTYADNVVVVAVPVGPVPS